MKHTYYKLSESDKNFGAVVHLMHVKSVLVVPGYEHRALDRVRSGIEPPRESTNELWDAAFLTGETWMITSVGTHKRVRGEGLATTCLQEVFADADREQVTLILEADPDFDMDLDRLIAWYGRLGFEHISNYPHKVMVRFPKDA